MAIIRSTKQVLEIKGLISWPKRKEHIKLLAMAVLSDKERKKAEEILGPIAMLKEWTKAHSQRVFVAMIRQQEHGGYKKGGPNSLIWLIRRYFMAFGKLVLPAESILNAIKTTRMLFLKEWDPYRCCERLAWIAQLNDQAEICFLKAFCQPGKAIYEGQELYHNFVIVQYFVGEGLIGKMNNAPPIHNHKHLYYSGIFVAAIVAFTLSLVL